MKDFASLKKQFKRVVAANAPTGPKVDMKRLIQIIHDVEDGDGSTFKKVGEKFGMTRERIRQLYRLGKHYQTIGKLPKEELVMPEIMDTTNLALIILQEIRDALARGTRHYRKSDNKLLVSEKEILEALLAEGIIDLDCSHRQCIG